MGVSNRFWQFLTDPAHRRRAALVLLGAFLATGAFVTAVYAWEYTSQPVFCGTTCHTMPPEYDPYQQSSHARVACVTCHVSKGVNTAVMEKITDIRHVILFTFKAYETPIRIKALRPAREACENCHWPEKFYGDRVNRLVHFQSNAQNTELDTYLIMKTGGGAVRVGKGYGIHWHVENKVEFVATDDQGQSIPWVRATFPDDSVVEYFDSDAKLSQSALSKMTVQTMECVDCHNRAAHRIKSPEALIDDALASKLIDRTLPEVKAKSVEALLAPVETRQRSIQGLDEFYRTKYPDVYGQKKSAITSAIALIKQLDAETSFPDLQENWKTYPTNTGHKDFPGCFRCHDGKHITTDTNVAPERLSIRLQCNICHTIPETVIAGRVPQFTAIVAATEPAYHYRTDWMARHPKQVDASCVACHGEIKYSANPTPDNQSFCANVSCHGTGWKKYISLIEIQNPGMPPLPSQGGGAPPVSTTPVTPSGPGGIPGIPADHAGRAADSCLVCHGPSGVRPVPASHSGRTTSTCTGCHKATPTTGLPTTPAPAARTPTPAVSSQTPGLPASHAGRTADQCMICHAAGGIRPMPANHAGRTSDMCLACHKAAAAPTSPTKAAGLGPLPASHAGRTAATCLACHGPAGLRPAPASHAGRTADTCTACHTPA